MIHIRYYSHRATILEGFRCPTLGLTRSKTSIIIATINTKWLRQCIYIDSLYIFRQSVHI